MSTENGAIRSEAALRLISTLTDKGVARLMEPIKLSSGTMSHHFVDVKRALASGPDLANAAAAVVDLAAGQNLEFDAVGGLTLGADHIGAAIALRAGVDWFVVRKEIKAHGTRREIEGSRIGRGSRVLLIDDVVTSGQSILDAYQAVTAVEATVVAAVALVDRGESTRTRFDELGVPFHSVVTYSDLQIEPVEPAGAVGTLR